MVKPGLDSGNLTRALLAQQSSSLVTYTGCQGPRDMSLDALGMADTDRKHPAPLVGVPWHLLAFQASPNGTGQDWFAMGSLAR
jgi:hypothetical protein